MVHESPPLGTIASLAASGTIELGPIAIKNARSVAVTIRGTTHASATLPIRVKLRYSPNAKNYDTVDYCFFDLDLSAGNATQETHLIDCPETGYMSLLVNNTDTSFAATLISVWVNVVRWPDELSSHDKV